MPGEIDFAVLKAEARRTPDACAALVRLPRSLILWKFGAGVKPASQAGDQIMIGLRRRVFGSFGFPAPARPISA